MTRRFEKGQNYRWDIPDTDAGIAEKVGVAYQLIMSAKDTPELLELAREIVSSSTTTTEAVSSVYRFVNENMEFREDVGANDVFVAAHRQFDRLRTKGVAWGDCDDYVIFGGSLLHLLGFDIRAVVSATTNGDGEFNHIFFEVFDPARGWTVFDAVRKNRKLGVTTPFSKRRIYQPLKGVEL